MGNLDRIKQWTFVQFLGVGVAVTAFYYFTMFDSGDRLVSQTKQVQQTLEDKKAELEKIRKAQAEKEKTEEEMNLIAEQFKSVLQFLPTEFNQADLMRDVIDEARLAGTRNIKIEPENRSERGDFYEAMFIQISFESSFAQAATFLSSLTKIPRIINVAKVELTTKEQKDDQPLLSFQGTLVGYRYLETKPDPNQPPSGGK